MTRSSLRAEIALLPASSARLRLFTTSFIVSFIAIMSVSCTLLKLPDYEECSVDSDCAVGLEVCYEHLCTAERSRCRWSPRYEDGLIMRYTPQGEPVIGVLADRERFSLSGDQRSAYLGLHTGLEAVTRLNQSSSATLLICDPSPGARNEALSAFREHGVNVVIGRPEASEETTADQEDASMSDPLEGEMRYISIDLEPPPSYEEHPDESLKPLRSANNWLRLASSHVDLERAFESVSAQVLEHITETQQLFNVMITLPRAYGIDESIRPDYLGDLIWRLSPYRESPFRTLIVYQGSQLLIDDKLSDFLQNSRPLQLIVSPRSMFTSQAQALLTAAANLSVVPTSGPLYALSMLWDVNARVFTHPTEWSDVIQLGLIYPPHDELIAQSDDFTSQEVERFELLQEESRALGTQLGGITTVGESYFSLAYDAGVIAALTTLQEGESQLFSELIAQEPKSDLELLGIRDYLTTDVIVGLLVALSEGRPSILNGRTLNGLSGFIRHYEYDEPSAPPLFVCSKGGLVPLTFPLESDDRVIDTTQGIRDLFRLPEGALRACDQQQ